ncbi:MAG: tRNA adenosine(34) deaminase TadA [Clostridiales bacterium]|jgi:tRNA(adenine34) deaminase|nr:tRNA adenosine(34) deaminase TadA [Clostridiales bacterium]
MDHLDFMRLAYEEALKALKLNEVPVGCVITYQGQVIAKGMNRRHADKTVLAHAEIIAIRQACEFIGDWRLEGCSLYVTVEPCCMCAGAIVQARIDEVVYAAENKKAGCAGSVMNILQNPGFNHQARVVSGIMRDECSELMTFFFRKYRSSLQP